MIFDRLRALQNVSMGIRGSRHGKSFGFKNSYQFHRLHYFRVTYMKNFDQLPLDESRMQRVKKLAETHQRFGGIFIDVIGGDRTSHQYLIRVKDKKGGYNK
jgi:hypothetical protein